MSIDHPSADSAELAALYASGAMTPHECAEFERHLADSCTLCLSELRALDEVVAALASAAAQPPPAHLRQQLAARTATPDAPQVWRQWTPPAASDQLFVQRAADGIWEETGVPGVTIRRLFLDPSRNQFTALVRMAAGAAYPRHLHNGPEECLVLEGDLHVGADLLRQGDYQRAPAGSLHTIQSTRAGCLLLITSSLSDDLL